MNLSGSMTALITPFVDDSIDTQALSALVSWQIANGTSALVVLGSTGESSTLSRNEKESIIASVVEAAGGRVPIIAGITSASTSEVCDNARMAEKAGADALLIASPYYNRPTPDGLFRHFEQAAQTTDLPIILYNIPSRSAVDMAVDLVLRLAELPTVVGIKESSGDLEKASDIIAKSPSGFAVIAGEDSLTLPLLALGASGVISVCANVVPDLSAELVSAFHSGNVMRAREIHYDLLPLWRALFLETNPGPLKAACALRGLCSDEMRLPLVPATDSTRAQLASVFEGMANRML